MAAMESAQLTTIEFDGYIINNETGEVVDLISPAQEFHVTDASSADWVLQKLCDAESEIARRRLIIASVIERQETEIRAQERRIEYLKFRFGQELEAFAKENLPANKKTWKGTYGEVSFRLTSPRLDVVNEGDAIRWAQANAPDAVKVETSLLKSKLPAELLDLPAAALGSMGLSAVPAGESVTIRTVKA